MPTTLTEIRIQYPHLAQQFKAWGGEEAGQVPQFGGCGLM